LCKDANKHLRRRAPNQTFFDQKDTDRGYKSNIMQPTSFQDDSQKSCNLFESWKNHKQLFGLSVVRKCKKILANHGIFMYLKHLEKVELS